MKTSIYLPDDLAEEVKRHEISISTVSQEALRKEVAKMQARAAVTEDIEKVAARLRESKNDEAEQVRQEGHEDGVFWAKEWATYDELSAIASHDTGFGIKFAPEQIIDRFDSVNEFLSDPHRVNDQSAGRMFDEDWPYRREFFVGFAEGVQEVWKAVRNIV